MPRHAHQLWPVRDLASLNRSVGKPSESHEHAAQVCHSLNWNNTASSLTAQHSQGHHRSQDTTSSESNVLAFSDPQVLRSTHSHAVWGS